MRPADTGKAYDRIAGWWAEQDAGNRTGLRFLEHAIGLCARRGAALDVGCGTGRMLGPLVGAGFQVTGLDVAGRMLDVARRRHPGVRLLQADVTSGIGSSACRGARHYW